MSDFFLVCAAFNGSSATWSQCARDQVVSFELLETQSWTCPDGAPSASALPAHAGIAGALPAGVAAAEVRVPFPRGAATFVRSGSGRIEPTATPAAPAITNTVILRTTNPTIQVRLLKRRTRGCARGKLCRFRSWCLGL